MSDDIPHLATDGSLMGKLCIYFCLLLSSELFLQTFFGRNLGLDFFLPFEYIIILAIFVFLHIGLLAQYVHDSHTLRGICNRGFEGSKVLDP